MQFSPALVRHNRQEPSPPSATRPRLRQSAAFICVYVFILQHLCLCIYFAAFICDDFQATPEATIPDPPSEFGTGDSCQLIGKDELSKESLAGWPKGCRGGWEAGWGCWFEGEGQGYHPRTPSLKPSDGEGPVLRRLGLMDIEAIQVTDDHQGLWEKWGQGTVLGRAWAEKA